MDNIFDLKFIRTFFELYENEAQAMSQAIHTKDD